MMDTLKDMDKFARILVMKAAVGILVGVVWFGAGEPLNENLLATNGALFLLVLNGVLDTVILCILTFPVQRTLLLREYKNGNYALLPWFAARVISDALFCVIFQMCLTLPVFFMVGFQLSVVRFFVFAAAMVLTGLPVGLQIVAAATLK